jgi:hypothetical protein
MRRSQHLTTRQGNNHKQRNAHRRGSANNSNTNNDAGNANARIVFFTVVAVVLLSLATCLYLAQQPELSETQKHLFTSLLIMGEVGVGLLFGRIFIDRS